MYILYHHITLYYCITGSFRAKAPKFQKSSIIHGDHLGFVHLYK